MKYKVGDRVELIQATSCTNGFKVGEIYKITQIDCVGQYKIQIVNNEDTHGYVDEEHIERVFTKSDLKDGDIVTLRNNKRKRVIGQNLISEEGSINLNYYINKLINVVDNSFDIIKVERRPERLETVFERKKEILNKAEKEYLSSVIRPFRDIVMDITKVSTQGKHYISIDTINDSSIDFPVFEIGAMYKNMEVGKLYNLEELGL